MEAIVPDLYHVCVNRLGFETFCREEKWSELGMSAGADVSSAAAVCDRILRRFVGSGWMSAGEDMNFVLELEGFHSWWCPQHGHESLT